MESENCLVRQNARDVIRRLLSEQPIVKTSQLLKATKVSRQRLFQLLNELITSGFIKKVGRAAYTVQDNVEYLDPVKGRIKAVFSIIKQHNGGIKLSRLANQLGIKKSILDWTLRLMIKQGLIVRLRFGWYDINPIKKEADNDRLPDGKGISNLYC